MLLSSQFKMFPSELVNEFFSLNFSTKDIFITPYIVFCFFCEPHSVFQHQF